MLSAYLSTFQHTSRSNMLLLPFILKIAVLERSQWPKSIQVAVAQLQFDLHQNILDQNISRAQTLTCFPPTFSCVEDSNKLPVKRFRQLSQCTDLFPQYVQLSTEQAAQKCQTKLDGKSFSNQFVRVMAEIKFQKSKRRSLHQIADNAAQQYPYPEPMAKITSQSTSDGDGEIRVIDD